MRNAQRRDKPRQLCPRAPAFDPGRLAMESRNRGLRLRAHHAAPATGRIAAGRGMRMFNIARRELQWGDETLVLETGKIARQADASVVATLGETTVLATVVFEKKPREGLDFFPLTVHYQEKYYAAGKIPGGFFKREARPTEKEVLTSRLIDRPIRPLFVPGFKNETQVVATVLSHDMENDPDIVAM